MKCIKKIWLSGLMAITVCHATILYAQQDTLCFNDTILYRVPGANNSTYEWSISGGSIIYNSVNHDTIIVVWNQTNSLHYLEAIKYSENNCSSEPERIDVFISQPVLELGDDITICEGANEIIYASNGFDEYLWNGQSGTNEFNIYEEGWVILEIRDVYGCQAKDSLFVLSNETPEPDFVMNIDTLNRSVNIDNQSDSSWQYQWNFGDGSISNVYNPDTHFYSESGSYIITLSATNNGCSSVMQEEVFFAEPLQADFIFETQGCAPATVTFINISTGADSYYWEFGNGAISTEINPTFIYHEPGRYIVNLHAINVSDTNVFSIPVIINLSPVADFAISPEVTNTHSEITFINNSINAIRYLWDFGDSQSSEAYSPTHSYISEGVFDVSLSVWSEAGCFDSLLVDNAVNVRAACRMLFPDGFVPDKNGGNGGYYDPSQLIDNNRIFHPIYENIEEYELKLYNRWGELIFVSNNIDIGWDGYYKGKLAPQETYIYQVRAKCITGEEISKKGSVTLIY